MSLERILFNMNYSMNNQKLLHGLAVDCSQLQCPNTLTITHYLMLSLQLIFVGTVGIISDLVRFAEKADSLIQMKP